MCGITTQLTKRISKRGIVLKVRSGCYNYIFKLYKWLNVATKTVVANSSWKNTYNKETDEIWDIFIV